MATLEFTVDKTVPRLKAFNGKTLVLKKAHCAAGFADDLLNETSLVIQFWNIEGEEKEIIDLVPYTWLEGELHKTKTGITIDEEYAIPSGCTDIVVKLINPRQIDIKISLTAEVLNHA